MMAAATLRLSRRWGGTGNDREWGMEIDGSVVGSIAYRQTWPVMVAALVKPDLWILLKLE
jgi:hypothetical protein